MNGAIPTMDGRIHQWHATYAFDSLDSLLHVSKNVLDPFTGRITLKQCDKELS